jgi:hypothetical protein
MWFSLQKATMIVFVSVTLVSSILILYTVPIYFKVFKGLRSFNIALPVLEAKVANSSNVSVVTSFEVQNPSELTYELLQAVETLTLEGKYILAKTLSFRQFVQLNPNSTVTLSINALVPVDKVSYVEARLSSPWLVYIRIFVRGPLVEQFSWTNTWLVSDMTHFQINARNYLEMLHGEDPSGKIRN